MCNLRLVIAALLYSSIAANGQQARAPVRTSADTATVAMRVDSQTPSRLDYEQQLRALEPQLRVAERAAAVADSLRLTTLPTDTVRVGAFRLLSDAAYAERLQAALEVAWAGLVRVYGTSADQLTGHLFIARARPSGTAGGGVIDIGEVFPGRLDIFDRVTLQDGPQRIASGLSVRAGKMILADVDTILVRWLMEPIAPGEKPPRYHQRIYSDLVTSPSQVATRCLVGDLGRCRDALVLRGPADALTEWYAPAERRLLVVQRREFFRNGPRARTYDACDERSVYEACERLVRDAAHYVIPPPLPVSSRHLLLTTAIDMGGEGAFARLVAGVNRTVEQRLSAAARAPVDSIVSKWRTKLIEHRPPSPTPSLLTAWTAVAWGIGAMLIGLRAAKWR